MARELVSGEEGGPAYEVKGSHCPFAGAHSTARPELSCRSRRLLFRLRGCLSRPRRRPGNHPTYPEPPLRSLRFPSDPLIVALPCWRPQPCRFRVRGPRRKSLGMLPLSALSALVQPLPSGPPRSVTLCRSHPAGEVNVLGKLKNPGGSLGNAARSGFAPHNNVGNELLR